MDQPRVSAVKNAGMHRSGSSRVRSLWAAFLAVALVVGMLTAGPAAVRLSPAQAADDITTSQGGVEVIWECEAITVTSQLPMAQIHVVQGDVKTEHNPRADRVWRLTDTPGITTVWVKARGNDLRFDRPVPDPCGAVNTAPVADAGSDQSVTLGAVALLDGTGSSDADGDALRHAWTLTTPSGSAATLDDGSSSAPTFTPDLVGEYVATLVVHDGTVGSAPDSVTITVSEAPNQAPTANAGDDQTVTLGETVTLDGTNSSDPDGDTLTYTWTLTGPDSSTATLDDTTSASPTFTPDLAGDYAAQLTVNDGDLDSTSDTVTITVAPIPNTAPVADAGDDQTVLVGDAVTLDGTASSDPDGDTLTHTWTLTGPDGSNATLDDATSATPTFTPDLAGDYTAELTVNDGNGATDADSVTITVEEPPNQAPTADAGEDTTGVVGEPMSLDGTGSTDPDGDTLTYTWTLTGPAGSTATLNDTTAALPTFTPDVAGDYTAQLVVNDGTTNSTEDSVTITVTHRPVAAAGIDQAGLVVELVTLNGTGSSDGDGDSLTYAWTLTVPAGSTATLNDTTAALPTFTPDVAGEYTATLVVNDGTNDSTEDSVTITVTHRPVADAGPDQTVTLGDLVTLDGTGSTDGDGDSLVFAWSLTGPTGSTAMLSDPLIAQPTFTPDLTGTYTVTLTVTDGTYISAIDTVTITVNEVPNSAPVADAGADHVGVVGEAISLDGTESSDPDGDSLTYAWTLTGPDGSTATLSDTTSALPTFTPDLAGDYTATLVVNDGTNDSTEDSVTITVTHRPVADAGPDQTVTLGDLVTLDGTGSTDGDDDSLVFAWSLTGPTGSTAMLSDPLIAQPTFTPDLTGTYTVTLTVTDGTYISAIDTVTITVNEIPNSAPVADAGDDQTVTLGDTVTLDGTGSTDPEGDTLTYTWALAGPSGSTATLSGTTSATPSFIPDLAGDYTAQLVVNDGDLDSTSDTVTITVEPIPNTAPVADAGDDQTVLVGDNVTLDGTGSSDPDGDSLTYTWVLAGPAGSTATLDDATSTSPTFTPDLAGDYTAQLTVNDGVTDSTADSVTITATLPTLVVGSLELPTYDSGTLRVTLERPTGSSGTVLFLASDNTSVLTPPASVTISPGTTTVDIPLTSGSSAGTAVISATASGYASGAGSVTVTERTMALELEPLVGIGRSIPGTVVLDEPAPTGGLTVTLTSSNTALVTVTPSTVTIASGATTAEFEATGVAEGSAIITASASGYADATAETGSTNSTVSVGNVPVLSPGQTGSMPISLSEPAPAGGTSILLESSDTDVVTVQGSVVIPEGALVPAVNPQVTGVAVGTAVVTARAEGYAPHSRTATVELVLTLTPTGTITLNEGRSRTMTVGLSGPAPVGGVEVTLESLHPTIFSVPGSVTVPVGQTTASFDVQALSEGESQLVVSANGAASITRAVHINPMPAISTGGTFWVGKDLQSAPYTRLVVDPVAPTDVTVTVADDSVAVVSTSATALGSASLTFEGVTHTNWLYFQVQGLALGTTTVTVSAPGYAESTSEITVSPSGFHLQTSTINTTTFATDSPIDVSSWRINDQGNLSAPQPLRAGADATMTLTNSDAAVGTLTSNTLTFNGNQSSARTYFDPQSAGSTTIALLQPAGWTQPANGRTSLIATVTAPELTLSGTYTVGKDLQTSPYGRLTVTPPTPTDLTLTIADESVAVISASATTVGSKTITFEDVTTNGWNHFHLQGLAEGTTTLTASAPGFADHTVDITVRPSGFQITTTAIDTTTFSPNSTVRVESWALQANGNTWTPQPLRAGVNATIDLANSNNAVGTLTENTVTIASGSSLATTSFDPATAGTTTISMTQPTDWTQPANGRTSLIATVEAPEITLGGTYTVQMGAESNTYTRLLVAPPSATDITLSVSSESTALLSTSAGGAGTKSITLEGITNTGWNYFHVQGVAPGTTTLTASAPGYSDDTVTITVTP